ncbi:MAG: RNA-binding protein [Dehalococcoidia bacterium]|nr:RNA-binding protein [Dehalococcoidia bacterium]
MRIYVGNMSFDTTEDELKTAFGAHGQVAEVTFIRDRDTGRAKGFGFVEMPSATEAQAAIAALNGKEMGSRTLTVNEAKPRTEGGFGGGNRGGSSGSRGGYQGGSGGGQGSRGGGDRTPRW